ncbi:MAG TPA: ATP12 family protein [Thermohalobaculum sp.]|nr:ATP12 family protein [Thermohalobaculum sp.]
MKRFWSDVTVQPVDGGFAIRLDSRPLRTPSKLPCLIPTAALAEALAAEWAAQGAEVNPDAMPLTRAANTTIDRVAPEHDAVAAIIANFGGTDLICYRAPHPEGLAQRQSQAWNPLVTWASQALDAPLVVAVGVVHVAQPTDSLAKLDAAVRAHRPWELTALHDLVSISGSLVIGLAVSRGHLDAETAWPLSRIDESWQVERWGEDAEAAAVTARRRVDFANAARLLALVRS